MRIMKKKSMLDLHRINCEQFKNTPKIPLVVVLDDVRSLNNIGSVFRTADAFVIESIYLCGITACPPSVEIHKTALGAEDSVEWHYFEDACEAVDKLKQKGYKICAIEQVQGSISLENFVVDKNEKYVVILGNEVKGVSQKLVDNSDFCIELPQYGTKHSLNVSITAGIVMWEFLRHLELNK